MTYLSSCSDNGTGLRVLLVYVATPLPHAVLSCLFRLYPGIDSDLCVTFASIFVSVRVITSCFTVNSLTSCHFARRPLIFYVASQSLPAASFLAELGAIFDVVGNGFLITGLCVLLLTEFLFEDRVFLCAGCAGADGFFLLPLSVLHFPLVFAYGEVNTRSAPALAPFPASFRSAASPVSVALVGPVSFSFLFVP